jgi:hypothetical protein
MMDEVEARHADVGYDAVELHAATDRGGLPQSMTS